MKFLKRIFHVPSSTSNSATLLEVGALPIRCEIEARKMKFLHHILELHIDDPVRQVYIQQERYTYERNWHNEVKDLLKYYGLTSNETEVKKVSREAWKSKVMEKVKKKALEELNEICRGQSKTSMYPKKEELLHEVYMKELNSKRTRIMFSARTGVLDVKSLRPYKYNDKTCRLCGQEDESVDHVLNGCNSVTCIEVERRKIDIYSDKIDEIEEAACRIQDFLDKCEELEV